jgi:integrase
MQQYRDGLVPLVLGKKHKHLLVSVEGAAKAHKTIQQQFAAAIRKNLGIKMTIHQVRHLAAKLMLDAHPGAHETVRQLLGHRHLKTTMGFYGEANTRRAVQLHSQLIELMRDRRGFQ